MRHGKDVGLRPREPTQRGQITRQKIWLQVERERGLQRCQRQLGQAQRTLHRELADAADRCLAADNQAGLRTTEQLVAGEGDDVATGGQHLLRRGLLGQAVLAHVDQRAAAEVRGQQHPLGFRQRRQLGLGDGGGEALHGVVASVHLHQQRGGGVDGALVVGQVRAVGGAHLHHLRAGAGHDVGHAEGSADLDQLATRHHHLLVARQRSNGQQHGGGIVVDHGGGLGPGDLAQQAFDDAVAVASAAAGQVVLQVVGAGHHGRDVLDGHLRQHGAAEVGVDHRAGEVDHALHARRQPLGAMPGQHLREASLIQRVGRRLAGQQLLTQLGQQRTRLPGHQRGTVLRHQRRAVVEKSVNGREPAEHRLRTMNHGSVGRCHYGAPAWLGSAAWASSPGSPQSSM